MKCVPKLKIVSCILIILASNPMILSAGGASEESSGERGSYVAEQGQIIPADEINISSWIASEDYGYPDPLKGDFGVNIYTGHQKIPLNGHKELIQIGIQGRRFRFEELPVMNIGIVLDISGSMSERDKMEWVRTAVSRLVERMRPRDYLSVTAFAGDAIVLLPPVRAGEITERQTIREMLKNILPEGVSDTADGLALSYSLTEKFFKPEQVNRVILLSDGLGETEGTEEIIRKYRDRGITLSTVTFGLNCNTGRMGDWARAGAGSSRFISSTDKLEDVFYADFDRMAVPLAYDLEIEARFSPGVEISGTWGYDYRISGNTVRYHIPALHHRDYETILAEVVIPKTDKTGRSVLGNVSVSFTDRSGKNVSADYVEISVFYSDTASSFGGISDPAVLRAGTMLHTALYLERIGNLYYSNEPEEVRKNNLTRSAWRNRDVPEQEMVAELVAREEEENNLAVAAVKQRCLDLSVEALKELENTRLRLGEEYFADELAIAEKYIEIIGNEMGLDKTVIKRLMEDTALSAGTGSAESQKQLESLVSELTFGLESGDRGNVSFFGFVSENNSDHLKEEADRTVLRRLAGLKNYSISPSKEIDETLEKLNTAPEDLLDNAAILRAGSLLGADLLITGRIVDMQDSSIVFGKLINQQSGEVESVAQVVIKKMQ